MKLKHITLDEVNSTQEYLKNIELIEGQQTLVSARRQVKGHGRQGRTWTQLEQTICFSFSLPKRENLTICSSEISLYVLSFLKENFHFHGYLKWPNDLLCQHGNKVAGILIDVIKDRVLVGIGINFQSGRITHNFNASAINEEQPLEESQYHEIPKQIFEYIFKRYPQDHLQIILQWNQNCYHLDKDVTIKDDQQITKGKFKGLGEMGEALLFTPSQKLVSVFNGSLRSE